LESPWRPPPISDKVIYRDGAAFINEIASFCEQAKKFQLPISEDEQF
jgi:hypothetical protein